jgi:hypothetical protein
VELRVELHRQLEHLDRLTSRLFSERPRGEVRSAEERIVGLRVLRDALLQRKPFLFLQPDIQLRRDAFGDPRLRLDDLARRDLHIDDIFPSRDAIVGSLDEARRHAHHRPREQRTGCRPGREKTL